MTQMAKFSPPKKIMPRRQHDWFRALIGMVLIGIAAHAGLPYLPVYGPPAMRMTAKPPPPPAVVEVKADKIPTNVPPMLATVPAMPTNSFSGETNASAELIAMPRMPGDENFPLNAQGMVAITPQVLAAYFRPVTFGTNSGVITGGEPLGFVPPFTHPDSRAEYIVK